MFVRYHSHDYGAGHVAWGFDWGAGLVNTGSVENHSGHLVASAQSMGFWTEFTADPAAVALEHKYDDVKVFEVEHPNPVRAYRVVKWIGSKQYRAVTRNCEDDCYDVLRAFGVSGLEAPLFNWVPNSWFRRVRGECMPIARLPQIAGVSADAAISSGTEPRDAQNLAPLHPPWRRLWHADFGRFLVARTLRRVPKGA